jgi:hypothetical protein
LAECVKPIRSEKTAPAPTGLPSSGTAANTGLNFGRVGCDQYFSKTKTPMNFGRCYGFELSKRIDPFELWKA